MVKRLVILQQAQGQPKRLQQKRRDESLGLIGMNEAAADLETVITAAFTDFDLARWRHPLRHRAEQAGKSFPAA